MNNVEFQEFFQRYIAVLNAHEFQRLPEFMHENLVVNGQAILRDQMIAQLQDHVVAVPDLVWHVEDSVVKDDRVAAYFRNHGTPVREWLGAQPTGAAVEYAEHLFHKVRNGRFYELNFLLDACSVRKQLGQ
jgi:predicted ester cyclase